MSGAAYTAHIMPPLTMPTATAERVDPETLADRLAGRVQAGALSLVDLVEATTAGRLDIEVARRAWVMAHPAPPEWPVDCPLPDDLRLTAPLIGKARPSQSKPEKRAARERREAKRERLMAAALEVARPGDSLEDIAGRVVGSPRSLSTWRQQFPEWCAELDKRRQGNRRGCSVKAQGARTRAAILAAAAAGDSVADVADSTGIPVPTINYHIYKYADFRKAFREATRG